MGNSSEFRRELCRISFRSYRIQVFLWVTYWPEFRLQDSALKSAATTACTDHLFLLPSVWSLGNLLYIMRRTFISLFSENNLSHHVTLPSIATVTNESSFNTCNAGCRFHLCHVSYRFQTA